MIPVEMSITLYDEVERTGFNRFLNDLTNYRVEKHQAAQQQTAQAVEAQQVEAVADVIDAEYAEQPQAPEGGEAVVGTITPKVPTPAQMFDALREFVRKNQAPAALALLSKHGVQKITDEMTDEVRVALYAELTKK